MTKDVQIIADESSYTLWSDLKRALPSIAEEFGCSLDQLHVMDYHAFPGRFMDTKHRDIPYKLAGLFDGMPFVQNQGLHSSGKCGYGISFFKNRLYPEVQYAVFLQRGEWGDQVFVIVRKTQVFLLMRAASRLTKKANVIKDIPILEDGVLDIVVRSTIGFLKNAKKIEAYGVKIKRGLLLDGPPGNGKTMLCRYIQKLCTERNYRWGVVTAADIDKAYADKELTPLFQMYTVTFFDDIDVSYLNRREGAGKMACTLLTAMDGMYEGGHLVRIFTTNETIDKLDEAFTRPGRIDNIITLEKPNEILRERLIRTVWPKEIVEHIDVDQLVDESYDWSFAELEAIRTYLVTWKVVCGGDWDLNRALDEFAARKKENKKAMGFAGKGKKRKKPADDHEYTYEKEGCSSPASDKPSSSWN